ncbi:MAG: NUDIX domain-containing protein [Anaerolineales bacterium]
MWDVGAAGLVVDEGRVLLVRHAYGAGQGRWGVPGGFAHHDERLDEAAVREVFEETGIHAEVLSLVGVRTCYVPEGGAVFVFFRMRAVGSAEEEPRPDAIEVDEARYFTAGEISNLPEGEVIALSRAAALAVLEGGEGLVERPCPPKSGADYRAFLVAGRE